MHEVMRCGWPSDDHQLTYMPDAEARAILAEQGVSLGRVGGDVPSVGEDAGGRLRAALTHTYASSGGEHVLVVSHGHALARLVEDATGETVYENDYCAYAVLERLQTREQAADSSQPAGTAHAAGALEGSIGQRTTKLVASSGYASMCLA